MTDPLIPDTVRTAAKRGFIRTACQSLSAVVPTTGIVLGLTADWWLAAGLGVASAAVTALLAGAGSYFSIISKGVPSDYLAAGPDGEG